MSRTPRHRLHALEALAGALAGALALFVPDPSLAGQPAAGASAPGSAGAPQPGAAPATPPATLPDAAPDALFDRAARAMSEGDHAAAAADFVHLAESHPA
ncbi:MAG TPA: hypothetical protein VNM90_08070, partial [Haliangium sp.]|nr:hypothetical protein [Haliangium sp.]